MVKHGWYVLYIELAIALSGNLKASLYISGYVLRKDFVKQKKSDPEQSIVKTHDDTDWSSWGTEPENITCLFCEHVCRSWDGTLLHMQVSHNFDFKNEISHFLFYQQVKMRL